MTAPVRVACLGAGYFSQFHYGSWRRLEGVDCVASCDLDLARAQATGLPAYDTLQNMLIEQSPDVLDIIVPPAGHAGAIRSALATGVRWILCQKPFCTSLSEAKTVSAEARDAGATLVIHENFRFQPWYRAMQHSLSQGAVGDVLQASFRLRPGDGQGPQAYLARQPTFQTMPRFLVQETAVHFVDTFRYLMGEITAVYADLRRINPVIAGEDAGYILFDHANGARALFDGNRHLDHVSDMPRRTMGEAMIEGTRGTLVLQGDGSVWLRGIGDLNRTCILAPDTCDLFGGDCVHALQGHVIRGILHGTPLENRAGDYLQNLRVVDAIYASADRATKVEVPQS